MALNIEIQIENEIIMNIWIYSIAISCVQKEKSPKNEKEWEMENVKNRNELQTTWWTR